MYSPEAVGSRDEERVSMDQHVAHRTLYWLGLPTAGDLGDWVGANPPRLGHCGPGPQATSKYLNAGHFGVFGQRSKRR